ncbi:unnamed protein product [Spodoptera exigua]|uniref:Uncharacterized protein n=1 Tax=Spodoptera exigua TaxID=7107 RepID=A0A835G7I9_SPOEX|nr:hypothetical protein HW555_012006 [Spodoptera exigua]KAH9630472.1 hypothetical protein HF086_017010 [Spodoptera exigua]CAH0694048.1 unnamed protein product [Spodoptera exigua]
MSGIFHKSCYTRRSSGYKYRTLATNTGDRVKPREVEDNGFEKKFRELRRAITTRVNKEVNRTHKARDSIMNKFEKLDNKINSMIELQNTVALLRNDLRSMGYALQQMTNKVDIIETLTARGEMYSLQSQRQSLRSQAPTIKEEVEDHDSIVTHI